MKRSFYEDFAGVPAWDLGMEGTFFINLEKQESVQGVSPGDRGRETKGMSFWKLCENDIKNTSFHGSKCFQSSHGNQALW